MQQFVAFWGCPLSVWRLSLTLHHTGAKALFWRPGALFSGSPALH